jgi:hypothetical protein
MSIEDLGLDEYTILFIVLGAIAVVGGLARWYSYIQFARSFKAAQQYESLLPMLEQSLRAYGSLPLYQQMQQQMQIQGMINNLNQQWGSLPMPQRQQYNPMTERLQGMAASAGFDWTPPSY